MKTIELKCHKCKKKFSRYLSEHKRSKKLKRKEFCSRECQSSYDWKEKLGKYVGTNTKNLKLGSELDDFSPFKWHMARIKSHTKGKNIEVSVTVQDLKRVWEKQNGKCPYTGLSLKNLESTNRKHQLERTPDRASLDRIDSSKGYTSDNIEFVSLMAQYCKNSFNKMEVLEFCKNVTIFNNLLGGNHASY